MCGGGGIMRTQRTINQHSPGGVAERKKKDGISIPIKKRVTSLPTLSLEKCVCVIVQESLAKGLIVRMKCFALCMFFPCSATVVFVFVCLGVKKKNVVTTLRHQPLIDKQDAFPLLPVRPELCSPPRIQKTMACS